MADAAAPAPKKRTFRKFHYRGLELEQLLDLGTDELVQLFPSRPRRRCARAPPPAPAATRHGPRAQPPTISVVHLPVTHSDETYWVVAQIT